MIVLLLFYPHYTICNGAITYSHGDHRKKRCTTGRINWLPPWPFKRSTSEAERPDNQPGQWMFPFQLRDITSSKEDKIVTMKNIVWLKRDHTKNYVFCGFSNILHAFWKHETHLQDKTCAAQHVLHRISCWFDVIAADESSFSLQRCTLAVFYIGLNRCECKRDARGLSWIIWMKAALQARVFSRVVQLRSQMT